MHDRLLLKVIADEAQRFANDMMQIFEEKATAKGLEVDETARDYFYSAFYHRQKELLTRTANRQLPRNNLLT